MADLRISLTQSRWQDGANLVLAIWLFISPWVLQFAHGSVGAVPIAAWDAWIVAAVVFVFSIAALAKAQPWEEWINIIAGAWLVASPWLLGFASETVPLWNALIVGVLIIVLAVWDLRTMPEIAERRF